MVLHMNDLTRNTARKPEISYGIQSRWQRIVDMIARVLRVPAAYIMRVDSPQIEVFLSSPTSKNPLQKTKLLELSGFYSERLIKQRSPLLVPDALKDPEWEHGLGAKLGMSYYLGYPVVWPDGEIFGTICVLDKKDNSRATQFRDLISEFQQVIERDLRLVIEAREHEDLLAEHQNYCNHLQKMVVELTADLKKNKEILEEHIGFDNLVSDISFNFVNAPHDKVDDEIALVLERIRQFFEADHCCIMEVLANRRQIHILNMNHQEARRQDVPNMDMTSGHPWAYQQLVEQGKSVIFSSLEALPPEASVDHVTWEKEGIQGALLLPLRVEGQVVHLIGLFSHRIAHEWPLVHIRRLRVLSQVFANFLVYRRIQQSLIRSEWVLAEAQRIAHLGSWDWDISTGEVHWSDEVFRICGLDPQAVRTTLKTFLDTVHPDDREAVRRALEESVSDPQKPYSMEHRVVRPDGAEHVVYECGETLLDQDRRPVQMIGTIHDVTERKRGEDALGKALNEIKKLKEQLEAENLYLREEIDLKGRFFEIVGESEAIKYVMDRVRQVAPTRMTVLLTGETGVGKGVFARSIHKVSDRRDKSFVNVNCAGLPPTLIESELFGREKGAFTGSNARQIGRFELAKDGTIFLDEIGELPFELQAKLLKIIEDGEFERLGNPHAVKVNVRIVASTNRDLWKEVEKGQFRKDLFYRLNVFPITIPPLRQRREDIPLLVKFYADKFIKGYNKRIKRIPKRTMKSLENYTWPGNVRELINVIERAVIVSDGPELGLFEKIEATPLLPEVITPKAEEKEEIRSINQVEREYFLKTLQETGWRIAGHQGAAQLLELKPSTLRARMKKLGIKRPGTHVNPS